MAQKQKTEQKATDKKTVSISPEIQKHLQTILATQGGGGGRNKFGHLISRPGGFIDEQLEQGKNPDAIVEAWAKQHPDRKPITAAKVVEEIKHLLSEHNFKVEVERSQPAKPRKAQG